MMLGAAGSSVEENGFLEGGLLEMDLLEEVAPDPRRIGHDVP